MLGWVRSRWASILGIGFALPEAWRVTVWFIDWVARIEFVSAWGPALMSYALNLPPLGSFAFMVLGLFLIWWDNRSKANALVQRAAATVGIATSETQPPAPIASYYSTRDRDEILDCLRRVSKILSDKAVPAREAHEPLLMGWDDQIFKDKDAYLARLKDVALQVAGVKDSIFAAQKEFSHYQGELAEILNAPFASAYEETIKNLARSISSIPDNAGKPVVHLLGPRIAELRNSLGDFNRWMSETHDKVEAKTREFRQLSGHS